MTGSEREASQAATAPPLPSIRAGVVAALPAEGRCLTKQRLPPGSSTSLAGALRLQLSGIGPKRARQAAENLLSAGAQALISWGVAGGLAPHLNSGVLLLPQRVQCLEGEEYCADPHWRQCLLNRLEGKLLLSSAPLHHTETILSSPEEKAHLYRHSGCVAVDMESGAVGQVASQAGVPFLVIRAIADPAQIALPATALTALNTHGRLQPLALLASLLSRPGDILGLWQLAKHFRAARATLQAVVTQVGPTLLAP
ncbi:purine phosphorylase [Nitrosococcus wardiae]|uniref:Purine phosphorylase n=1 Tax=Nitrosococcus wardiae TaxID=1814290 RepID=A0A4P7C2R5_9GAMM|nr:purine phosphorylase [Nitrosococcus wardiae]QBQ55987.1 purine phosphorylase [Nitrosococcus wardiae]